MCTIVLLRRVHPRYPLLVAANRDEFLARPTAAPALGVLGPDVVAGRDLAAGGTWMGATLGGLFAGLTNQRPSAVAGGVRMTGLRSRGLLVKAALEAPDLDAACERLAALDARETQEFNLIVADPRRAFVVYGRHDAARVRVAEVPEGISVLPNDVLDAPTFPKTARARAASRVAVDLAARGAPFDDVAAALVPVLAAHHTAPLEALPPPPPGSPLTAEFRRALDAMCIHTPVYGTRSAALVALGPGGLAHYRHANGPPCEAPFVDLLRPPAGVG
jgi:uncharacterized protein with NRDE domain